jgi:hypothetical protein
VKRVALAATQLNAGEIGYVSVTIGAAIPA